MKRLIIFATVTGLAAVAMATGAFLKTFNDTYKVKPDSTLGKAKCMICHTKASGGAFNAFGKDVYAALKESGGKKVTAEILKKVEGKDSDGDGMKNGEEIKKDRNPGVKN